MSHAESISNSYVHRFILKISSDLKLITKDYGPVYNAHQEHKHTTQKPNTILNQKRIAQLLTTLSEPLSYHPLFVKVTKTSHPTP